MSPPAHRGRWGRQDEIYPKKKEKKFSFVPPGTVSIPWLIWGWGGLLV